MIDAENKLSHHILIAVLSSLFVFVIGRSDMGYGRAVGSIPFLLLFLVMIIGPIMRLWPSIAKKVPGNFPWNWRAELGIWFAIWSVAHTLLVFRARDWEVVEYITGMSPWAFGAFVAVFMAIVLAAISFKGAINFLGADSWKWIQNYFTYVIFWLSSVHVVDRALLRPGFLSDDWLHRAYLIMIVLVFGLQMAAFLKTVFIHRKNKKEE